MPYKDPEKQREAVRRAQAKRRAKIAADAVRTPLSDILGLADLPDAPGDDELVKLLGVKARAGNVPAMKLLLERPWEKKTDGDSNSSESRDPLAGIDELAARRRA